MLNLSALWEGEGGRGPLLLGFLSFLCVSLQLLHPLSQRHTAELFLWGKASWTPSGSACPLFSLRHWAGCMPPALACCDRQQFILKYGVTGHIICPDALFCFHGGQEWEVETWSSSQSASMSVHVYGCQPVQSAGLLFWKFFSTLPLIPVMCELMNFSMFRVGFLHVLTEVKVIWAVPNSTSLLLEIKT